MGGESWRWRANKAWNPHELVWASRPMLSSLGRSSCSCSGRRRAELCASLGVGLASCSRRAAHIDRQGLPVNHPVCIFRPTSGRGNEGQIPFGKKAVLRLKALPSAEGTGARGRLEALCASSSPDSEAGSLADDETSVFEHPIALRPGCVGIDGAWRRL